jgi:hypothetical protein
MGGEEMKKIIAFLFALVCTLGIDAQTWDFSSVSDADKTLMNADATNWYNDTSKGRYNYLKALSEAALTANGTELAYAKGLLFTGPAGSSNTNGKFRINYNDGAVLS